MSQIEKAGRANMFVSKNREILVTVRKLLREYELNHSRAKSLFKKSQIDRSSIPEEYRDGNCPSYNFTSDW